MIGLNDFREAGNMSLFDKGRDLLARQAIAYRLRRYINRMTQFSLDSKAQTIRFSVDLKGEAEPLVGDVRYELTQSGGTLKFKITGINLSKEWMNLAAQDFAVGQEFSLADKRVETLLRLLNVI
jgi:hypothetical protein